MSSFDKSSCVSSGIESTGKGSSDSAMQIHSKHVNELWGVAKGYDKPIKKSTPRKLLKNRYRRTKTNLSFKAWIKTQS